jgi:hypothetical protein
MPDARRYFADLPDAIYGRGKRKTGKMLSANFVILILWALMDRKAESIKARHNWQKKSDNHGRKEM